ncbi:MAG TPA: hypothetical protein PLL32_00175 [Anaeromyxobacteraceae bacterium]|nr:hypothetical protein [Anaeromyxobacteraceae bacterium]
MTYRRLALAPVLALAISACTPSVPSNPNTTIFTAEFDPTANVIPLPNDLAINPLLNPSVLDPQNAQEELLAYFFASGGFPADQVVPLDFPLSLVQVNGPNDTPSTAPTIDLSTVKVCNGLQAPGGCNLFVFDATGAPAAQFPAIAVSQPTPAPGATSATLRITPVSGTAATTWRPGAQYFYALRGGASGIKTTTGAQLQPSATMYILLFGGPNDFNCPSTVPPAECPLKQLQLLQLQYQPIFTAIRNKGFPLTDTAVVGSFAVAPATTWVVADPGSGTVPVPSNFMLDPVTNKVSAAAAAAFGIPALASLDGFSTTGMDIALTSGPIKAGSVYNTAGNGVFLYKLGGTTPSEVRTVVVEPPPITVDTGTGQPCAIDGTGNFPATCVAPLIGIQPAVTVPTPGGPVAFPPLAERTTYAVVVTNRVTDPAGIPLSNTTLGQMLLFTHPLCTPSPACASSPSTATPAVPGVSGAQASLLESMRLQLQPVITQVATDHGVARADIVMPYVFRTQSITGDALQLGAAPYAKLPGTTTDAFPDEPVAAAAVAPDAMGRKWGVDPALFSPGISTFVEASILSFDKLDPTTGAFNPIPEAGTLVPLQTIVALPQGEPPAGGWPLVVFHHGLTRSRGDVLFIANVLASSGMVVAATDAAKHGERSWCVKDTITGVSTGCASGSTCDTTVFAQQQGDPPTGRPGLCTANALDLVPIGCNPAVTPGCWDGTGGNARTSGAFLISANLFRSRDTVRQDILDQSMVVRVLTAARGQAAIAAAADRAVVIDPTRVYYVGQSLGAIEGTIDVAANPRISRATLNVGGATIIDILTTSPAFASEFLGTLAQIGITPGTEEYLLFLIGAKWILDPADPSNFASHLALDPLPNLLADPSGGVLQDPKAILGQAALCDTVVPNATNQLLYGIAGLGPLAPTAASTTPGLQWWMQSASGACPADGVSHGFLLDWTQPATALAAQQNVASYLLGGPVAPTPVVP